LDGIEGMCILILEKALKYRDFVVSGELSDGIFSNQWVTETDAAATFRKELRKRPVIYHEILYNTLIINNTYIVKWDGYTGL